jgi:hypothetical protein
LISADLSFAAAIIFYFFAANINDNHMNTKEWINNPKRTYKDGLAIYHKVKRNKDKDAFLNSVGDAASGSIHFNLLLQEVKNAYRILLANNPEADQPSPKPQPGKPITTAKLVLGKKTKAPEVGSQTTKAKFVYNEMVDVKSLPADLQRLYFRNQDITREVAGLHQQLKAATSDDSRVLLAGQLESLFSERAANWTQIDRFAGVDASDQKQGGETEQETDTVTDSLSNKELAKQMLEAQKRLKTVKINISRVEKELTNDNLSASKVKSRKARLKVWKAELDDLESVLKGL